MVAELMLKRMAHTRFLKSLLASYPREEIVEGAIEIIAAEIAGSATNRDMLRIHFNREGVITSSIKSDKMLEKLPEPVKEEVKKFDIYKELYSIFSHKALSNPGD